MSVTAATSNLIILADDALTCTVVVFTIHCNVIILILITQLKDRSECEWNGRKYEFDRFP